MEQVYASMAQLESSCSSISDEMARLAFEAIAVWPRDAPADFDLSLEMEFNR